MAEMVVDVLIEAAPQQVWDALVDWDRQGEWMLLTTVRGTVADGQGVGGGVQARTGLGPVGVLDAMVIRVWEPPHRCAVRHTGRVVRGAGGFVVDDLGDGMCRFEWSEWLDLPLGALGRFGWHVARPVFRYGLIASLRRFKRYVEERAT